MPQSALKARLEADVKTAMRAKDKPRLGVLRLVMAAIKQREVDERIELDDTQLLAVLDKMLKQRRDSLSQYEAAGRDDLAQQEAFEIGVLQEFLPSALSESELDALIVQAIQISGASDIKDMGKLMAELRPKVQGRADMGMVSQKVKQALNT